jgi:hypothetical protein
MGSLTTYPLLENTLPEFRNTTVNTNANMHFGGNVVVDGTLTTTGTGMEGAQTIAATSANALLVAPLSGTANPVLNVDTSVTSAATGLNIQGTATGSTFGTILNTISSGTDEALTLNAKGAKAIFMSTLATNAGVQLGATASLTTTKFIVKAQNANAISAGVGGSTNPGFNLDSSTAGSVTGLNVKTFGVGNGLNLSVITSGTNEQLKVDAAGSGMISIGGISTGQISLGRGSVKPPITGSTITSLGTTQNSTPTAAQLVGGVVTQTGATGAGTVTLDNGTNISTAVPGVTVGTRSSVYLLTSVAVRH